MKTLKQLLVFSSLLVPFSGAAQVTAPTNAPTFGNYVGFNASSLIPLPIRNDAAQPIQWWTDGTRRMTLGATGNLALGNNQDPFSFVKFYVLQNRPVGIGVLAINNSEEVIGIQARVNTATSTTPFTARNVGMFAEILSEGNNVLINRGFQSNVEGPALLNYGAFHIAKNSVLPPNPPIGVVDSNVGARGIGYTDLTQEVINATNFGLIGEACGGRVNIGVYGADRPTGIEDCNDVPTSTNHAGYFAGSVVTLQPAIQPSDASLKQNIENLSNATEILTQLQAKTYNFKVDEYDFLSLAQGTRYGLISQEVEEVLPSLVRDFIHPSFTDSSGVLISPEVEIKGLNYIEFVPILIAGFNEQQAAIAAKDSQIEALEAKLESLEVQLTQVVQSVENALMHGSLSPEAAPEKSNSGSMLGQNVPNPFSNQTRVDFSLAHNAQVRLEIADGQGRVIETLIDGQLSAGMHSLMIDGSKYAPGMYYYSLYANGELLSKKMIKR